MRTKEISGYEGKYVIYEDGRVLRKPYKFRTEEKFLNPKIDRYLRITLFKGSEKRCLSVHRLLALHFLPNPENKSCINHKDGNKLNNALDNLEWATHSENAKHARKYLDIDFNSKKQRKIAGLLGKKTRKLTMGQATKIRGLSETMSRKEISRMFSVSASCIARIITKVSYVT